MKLKKLIVTGMLTCMMSLGAVSVCFAHAADEVEIIGATQDQESLIRDTLRKYVPEYKIAEFNREKENLSDWDKEEAGKFFVRENLYTTAYDRENGLEIPLYEQKAYSSGRGINLSSNYVNEEYVLRVFCDYLCKGCGQRNPKPIDKLAKKYDDGKKETYLDNGEYYTYDGGPVSSSFYDAYIAWKFGTEEIDTELCEYFEWLEKDYTVADEYGRIFQEMSAQNDLMAVLSNPNRLPQTYLYYVRDDSWRWIQDGDKRKFLMTAYVNYPSDPHLAAGGVKEYFIVFNDELQKPVLYYCDGMYIVSEEVLDDVEKARPLINRVSKVLILSDIRL